MGTVCVCSSPVVVFTAVNNNSVVPALPASKVQAKLPVIYGFCLKTNNNWSCRPSFDSHYSPDLVWIRVKILLVRTVEVADHPNSKRFLIAMVRATKVIKRRIQ